VAEMVRAAEIDLMDWSDIVRLIDAWEAKENSK
jgi:hypothetical protein